MAYGYGYNQPYMPGMMQNQYQQRLAQMEQASMPRFEIIHVNGENGAWIEFDYVPEEHDVRAGHPDYTGRLCTSDG